MRLSVLAGHDELEISFSRAANIPGRQLPKKSRLFMEKVKESPANKLATTPSSLANTRKVPVLGWEVFVTPGIPIVTPDRPPGIRQTYFQAMAATLIYGVRDAVLVDTFMTVTQATALADWVAARGRNLTTIYITHGHGDHWFGAATLLERFPNAKAVATPNAVRVMRQNASPEALEGSWKASFPGQIPERLVIAEELDGDLIDLEGHELVAVELGHTDTDDTTCLYVPSIGLVVAGDAAYNDVHLYLAESNAQTRQEWISAMPAAKPEASPAMRITPTLPWRYSTATTWNS